MTRPNITFWAKPNYPEVCRKERITGEVKVKILVNAEGNVEKTEVMEGPDCLRESALQAAGKCRFVAATKKGENVKAWMVIPYVFKLQ